MQIDIYAYIPTDRQTDRQTDTETKSVKKSTSSPEIINVSKY